MPFYIHSAQGAQQKHLGGAPKAFNSRENPTTQKDDGQFKRQKDS